MKNIPQTAKELVFTLYERYLPNAHPDWNATIHLFLKGDDGGNFEVVIGDGSLIINKELSSEPTLTLKTSAQVYYDIEFGKTDPKMAFFFGKISVSNLSEMSKLNDSFIRAVRFYG